MKRKAMAIALAALACVCIWLAVNATQNAALAWAVAAACAVLAVLIWKGKGKQRTVPKAQAAQPSASAYSFVNFNLSGVTFPNDEGISRQDLIRRIDKAQPPFENGGDLDVRLNPVKFRGEDAIECRVNGCQIGFVPKAMVPDVLAAMEKPGATISGFHVVGGEDGLSYGVSMAVRFEK